MKKILTAIIFSLIIFLPTRAEADEFKEISIDAKLDENGIGHIEETWRLVEDNHDYTERYKAIENLRGIKIEDFSLRAFGKDFQRLEPWDSDLSFEEKANHYGTIVDGDHVELCWGISKYEDNSYTLTYKINPLAIGLTDADMVFFNFVGENFDPKPERVKIKLSGYKPFKDIKFWGFGLEGNIENKDGSIVLESTGDIDYATLMVKFPKGTFATSYKENKTFDSYAKEAAIGSDWQEREGTAYQEPMPVFLKIILWILGIFGLVGGFWALRASKLHFNPKRIRNHKDLKLYTKFKGQYYKDIPYEGELEDLIFILEKILLVKTSIFESLINAYLIKWAINKDVEINGDNKLFSQITVKILNTPTNMGEKESKIFDIFYKIQEKSTNPYIKTKDVEKYFQKHSKELKTLFDEIEDYSIAVLKDKGYLKTVEFEKRFLATSKTGSELEISQEGIKLYENLIKFKNYLTDYEKVGNKDEEEIKKWKEFLIYSAIFGENKTFTQNLESYPYYVNNFLFYSAISSRTNSFSKSVGQSYGQATGLGGSTSMAGGGGSFGGGGGGGR